MGVTDYLIILNFTKDNRNKVIYWLTHNRQHQINIYFIN